MLNPLNSIQGQHDVIPTELNSLSVSYPDQRYIGLTSDLKARLAKHNEGSSPHASKYRPWKLAAFITFEDDDKAAAFEQYLKSGSGRAFANKHLW